MTKKAFAILLLISLVVSIFASLISIKQNRKENNPQISQEQLQEIINQTKKEKTITKNNKEANNEEIEITTLPELKQDKKEKENIGKKDQEKVEEKDAETIILDKKVNRDLPIDLIISFNDGTNKIFTTNSSFKELGGNCFEYLDLQEGIKKKVCKEYNIERFEKIN